MSGRGRDAAVDALLDALRSRLSSPQRVYEWPEHIRDAHRAWDGDFASRTRMTDRMFAEYALEAALPHVLSGPLPCAIDYCSASVIGLGLCDRHSDELAEGRAALLMVSDLDRCEHGRHQGDACYGCGAESAGNVNVQEGEPIGHAVRGARYVMPARGERHRPSAWLGEEER